VIRLYPVSEVHDEACFGMLTLEEEGVVLVAGDGYGDDGYGDPFDDADGGGSPDFTCEHGQQDQWGMNEGTLEGLGLLEVLE
jgi:hypothetical protein